jgi:Ca2+-binding RTX toxin-like protein
VLTFAGTANLGLAHQIANALAAASSSSALTIVNYTGGSTIPPVTSGTEELVLNATVTGAVTVPAAASGVSEVLVLPENDTNPVTIYGTPNLSIIGGGSNVTIIDPAVIDIGTNSTITSADAVTVTAADGPYTVAMGTGNESVVASGSGTIFLQGLAGSTNIVSASAGSDTIYSGVGSSTIQNTSTEVGGLDFGSSGAFYVEDSGTGDTIAAGSGDAFVTLAGSSALLYGGFSLVPSGVGTLTVDVTGNADSVGSSSGPVAATASGSNDVVAAGTSSTSILVSGASDLVYGPNGSGTASIDASGSSNLTVGGGTGSETVNAGTGSNLLVWGPTGNFDFVGGTGSATVIGEGASNTISSGSGPLLYSAGYDTPNSSTVTGTGVGGVTLYGAAGGAVTYGSSLEGGVFVAWAGNETLSAAGSPEANLFFGGQDSTNTVLAVAGSGNDTLVAGSGADTLQGGSGADLFAFVKDYINGAANDTILGFTSSDQATLFNYTAGEAATDLANATIAGGNTTIALSDGTHVTFVGVTDLTAHNNTFTS